MDTYARKETAACVHASVRTCPAYASVQCSSAKRRETTDDLLINNLVRPDVPTHGSSPNPCPRSLASYTSFSARSDVRSLCDSANMSPEQIAKYNCISSKKLSCSLTVRPMLRFGSRFQRNHRSNERRRGPGLQPRSIERRIGSREFIAASATHLSPFSQSLLHRKNIRSLSTDISSAVYLFFVARQKNVGLLSFVCTRLFPLDTIQLVTGLEEHSGDNSWRRPL